MGCINSKNSNKSRANSATASHSHSNNSALAGSNKQFVKDALTSHNHYRGLHAVGKLKLNKELCDTAQAWAERIANTNNFEHSNNMYMGQSLGENIAMRYTSTGDELTGKQMTEQWYEEANNYNYNEDFQQGKGHFAQIVWRSTREVGFGRAKALDGKWYAVANYFPAGNYIGQFRENVNPPKIDRL